MRRKEHLLLYTAAAAVLPAVMNFPRPELQEMCGGLGSSPPELPARCRGVQAAFDHTWPSSGITGICFPSTSWDRIP